LVVKKIGENCRIHNCDFIGTTAGYPDQVPKLGNNVYIAPGVKIFRPIEIADGVAMGSNSVCE
jgi:serine O-acetyltransferase